MSLFEAIKSRNLHLFEEILEKNPSCDLNEVDENENSLLRIAIEYKCNNIVQLLVKKGANVNYKSSHGYTPLMKAVLKSTSLMEILLKHDANVNDQNSRGLTALDMACQCGDFLAIELLLNYHANVEIKDKLIYNRNYPRVIKFINGYCFQKELHKLCIINDCEYHFYIQWLSKNLINDLIALIHFNYIYNYTHWLSRELLDDLLDLLSPQ